MSLCGTDQDKLRLVKRLHRIEGQVRGLCGMVERDENCIDVLRQIASVSGALRGVWLQVVDDHVRGCVRRGTADAADGDQLVDDLMENLKKICR